jgi:hypothetical protein
MLHSLISDIKEKIEKLNFELEENSNILEQYRKNMSISDDFYHYVHNEMGTETILFVLKERAVMEGKLEILSEILNFLIELK